MANLIANPSFEVDTNADGLADNWSIVKSVSGTPTTSRVAGLFGSYAQRVQYTSSSDAGKIVYLLSDLSAVGTVSSGQQVMGVAWVRLVSTGTVNVQSATYAADAAGTTISTGNTTHTSFPQNVWVPVMSTHLMPVNASRARFYIAIGLIDTGDSITLDVDGVYLSPDANFDHYGKYPVIGKGVRL